MSLEEAKETLVQAWGTLGSSWGVSRTMAQVHALLMVSPEALSTEEVMEQLKISRGNANMNLRDLTDWGIVQKINRSGERRDFYVAEKDIWKVAMQVAKERKKRELEPILRVLEQVSSVEADIMDPNAKQFAETVQNIKSFAQKADNALDTMIKAEQNWLWGSLLKALK